MVILISSRWYSSPLPLNFLSSKFCISLSRLTCFTRWWSSVIWKNWRDGGALGLFTCSPALSAIWARLFLCRTDPMSAQVALVSASLPVFLSSSSSRGSCLISLWHVSTQLALFGPVSISSLLTHLKTVCTCQIGGNSRVSVHVRIIAVGGQLCAFVWFYFR